ncbi:MAG: glutamate ABC transporter substrate-binding protein [Propionibacteriaceae bacterium]
MARPRWVIMTAACAMVVAGCASSYPATVVPTPAPSSSPSSVSAATPAACPDAVASYAPSGAIPTPSELPSGSYMATIKKRGRLIAGVSADTYLLGSRNPLNGTIEGFDIDLVKQVARAILGDQNAYELKVITAAQRIPALEDGSVDLVARNMTITCDRWTQIAFSAEYYRSGQKVLVRKGAKASKITDLSGQRVCAPNATSSMENLRQRAPKAIAVGSDSHTGCLVLFQQGQVDAITGDDTVLAGLAAQDPYAEVTAAPAFTQEPYGIGISLKHPDFVRFVNQRLAEIKSDGEWKRSYDRWLAGPLGPAPTPPKAVYGRNP